MVEKLIIGAVAGDMIGFLNKETSDKKSDCSHKFSGCSVLTVAIMDSMMNGRDYTATMLAYGRRFPDRGYGAAFNRWLRQEDPKPFNSWNNGAALRVSPVGFACRTLGEVLHEARNNALVSHNHPDGIKGAQAVASSVFLARTGRTKDEIRTYIESAFQYNLQKTINEIRPGYFYDQSCQASVPEAIIAFLDSHDFESAVNLAVSLGGNSSVLACITGGIAHAFYKEIPQQLAEDAISMMTPDMFGIIEEFSNTYPLSLFH